MDQIQFTQIKKWSKVQFTQYILAQVYHLLLLLMVIIGVFIQGMSETYPDLSDAYKNKNIIKKLILNKDTTVFMDLKYHVVIKKKDMMLEKLNMIMQTLDVFL